MEPEAKPEIVDDESALDQELEASLNTLKAGKPLAPAPAAPVAPAEPKEPEEEAEEVTPEVKAPAEPTGEAPAAEVKEGEESEGYNFDRIPNKGKFESDEAYEKRIELFDLIKRRKAAATPEAKAKLTEEIKTTKNQLRNLGGSDKSINNVNPTENIVPPEEDEALKADKERLKQLGGATKDDIREVIQETQHTAEVKSTLERFVEKHPELKDEDVREVFFDFVESNYNWQGKAGKDLLTVLELARESMFKPSESVQERVLKGAKVAEKVNAMQFPGGTMAKTTHSPEIKKSLDEMMQIPGMTEEKALELISD